MLVALACTEESTAPGVCPNFCPSGSISIKDTVFATIIDRDSSFGDFVPNYSAEAMSAVDLPGIVDSRAFVTFDTMTAVVHPHTSDTVPITVDSVRLRLAILRRDKHEPNLRLKLFQLPVALDSTSDFVSLDPYFTAPPVDSVNISTLLAQPKASDTAVINYWRTVCATCDTVRVDSAGNVLQMQADSSLLIYVKLDTSQAPINSSDTGRVAYGFRVAADSSPSVSLGTIESFDPPELQRFFHYRDSVATKPDSVVKTSRFAAPRFDSFVFTPPTPPLDTNLAVGGVPSARTLLRVEFPKFLHDSIDVVRATLILVPVKPVQGVASDSFNILARPVLADLGPKSPLSTTSALFGSTFMHIGTADTVRIELTNLVRAWAADTTMATSLVLGEVPEAASYTQARFYSSRAPAFRPALHVTFVHRFQFGVP